MADMPAADIASPDQNLNAKKDKDPGTDPISAELERALFKRFWSWLAIVGSVVVIVVSGFSVLASQFVSSVIDNRVQVAFEKISGLEARSLQSIDRIETRALDSAIKTTEAQAKSFAAAESAQSAVTSLQTRISALPKVEDLLSNNDAIVNGLRSNKDFVDRVSSSQSQAFLRLKEWGKGTASSGDRVGGVNGPYQSLCADGTYAVGILIWGNSAPPYCIGCLNAAQVVCRKLNIE